MIAPNGEVMFAIDHEVVDARWTPRGVLSIDRTCAIRCHDGGRLVDTRQVPGALAALAASLAAGGWRFARVERAWSVHSATGVELWRQRERIVYPHVAALSDDGCRFAVAHRGWAVVDIELDRRLDGGAGTAAAFAFDGRGEQLGIAMADGPSVVVRIGAPYPAPGIEAPGGCAVALDHAAACVAAVRLRAGDAAGRARTPAASTPSTAATWMWLDLRSARHRRHRVPRSRLPSPRVHRRPAARIEVLPVP